MREVDHREGSSTLMPPQKDSVKKLREKMHALVGDGEAKFRVDGYNSTAVVKVVNQPQSSSDLIVLRLRDDLPIEDSLNKKYHYPFREMRVFQESDETVVCTNFGEQTVYRSQLGQGKLVPEFDNIPPVFKADEIEQTVSFASEYEVQEMLQVANKITKKDQIDVYGKTLTEREKESGDALRIREQANTLLRSGRSTGKFSHITTVVFKTDMFDTIRISGETKGYRYKNNGVKIELDPVPHSHDAQEGRNATFIYYVGEDRVRGFTQDRSRIADNGEYIGSPELIPGAKFKDAARQQNPGLLTDRANIEEQERGELLDILLSLVNNR